MGMWAWIGRRGQPKAVGPVARARVGHLLAVQQRTDDLEGLLQPVQPLPEAAPELDPEGRVLADVPAAAQPQDGPTAADVVDGGDRLGDERRVAERVGAHEQAEPRVALVTAAQAARVV